MTAADELAGKPCGERIKFFRERAGMSRPVLGGLVGRSAEWVKAVETSRLQTPRLPMLIRIAQVLGVNDLADLTGEQRMLLSYTKSAHEALPKISEALTSYPIDLRDTEPVPAADLAARVRQAWDLWHGVRNQRTAIAVVLPGLLHDARVSARLLDGVERRRALRALAEIYHLAQLFLSFQPVPELIHLTGDRAMQADRLRLASMPSATRRSFHLIETARAYSLRNEHVATVHLLKNAYDESPDTIRFNLFARSIVLELSEAGGATIRDDVLDLKEKLGLSAA
ncbi:hypothetical protein TH66_03860 [Carbonactinospora thermoautotrophica]|uniref:HTH cro/C1-type domain-containing protein n=1 Tax=Carbonactinospora thermoautotrophica TaxID=1469144 RepID=A0A132NFR9_9ACTN|nr:helix-turn-helix transcriptional regulator [Carbonactinospora thermoautotrophica]KWX04940.1 hypothetical protein TH66_03860 [Carbonactinospora thermoautotrophica]KWX08951.1 hypothetical protein TR74_12515 [Carbonactinospora thermoautotrophica]